VSPFPTSIAIAALTAALGFSQEPARSTLAPRIAFEAGAQGFRIRFSSAAGPNLELDAVAVTIVGSDGRPTRRDLPFRDLTREDGAWRLDTGEGADHRFRLSLLPAAEGVEVRLVDAVGIRSRVLEIALEYRSLAPCQVHLPHLVVEPDDVAADPSFAAPFLLAQAGGGAFALVPGLHDLARNRRLPWYLARRG
jgi:hypothetical protein